MDWESLGPNDARFRFLNCEVKEPFVSIVTKKAQSVLTDRARYGLVSTHVGVPWYIVGAIHQLETGGSFDRHLHNGDPLLGRTIHVPIGRPYKDPGSGSFPYSWEESGMDALTDRFKPPQWGIGYALLFCEVYNGLGYRKHGVNSPYVWSMTTAYTSGKYVSDGTFDENAVSSQVGVAAILKVLQNYGELTGGLG